MNAILVIDPEQTELKIYYWSVFSIDIYNNWKSHVGAKYKEFFKN